MQFSDNIFAVILYQLCVLSKNAIQECKGQQVTISMQERGDGHLPDSDGGGFIIAGG